MLAAPRTRPVSVNSSRCGSSQMPRPTRAGDDAVAAQHDLPGEGLDDDADRQRQDDRDQHRDLHDGARAREREGGGIADDEADQRHQAATRSVLQITRQLNGSLKKAT